MSGFPRALLCLFALVALSVSCGDDGTGPLVPAKIVIIPNQPVLGQGLTLQLTATVVDAAGRAMPGEQVNFSSDAPAIVDISATGLMTSLGPVGDALITADDNGLTDTLRVQVSQRINSVVVTPNPLGLHRNTTFQLSPVATDVAGNAIPNGFSFVSSDPSVAAVDQAGLVTAPGATGAATITVTLDTLKVDVPVTVYARPTTVQVTPGSITIHPGTTTQLSAEVLDSLGDPISGAPISYTSQDPALVSVSTSGLVTANAATGAGIVKLQAGTLTEDVPVIVGNGILGTSTGRTMFGGIGNGVAFGPGGEMFAGALRARTVLRGTLPSHGLGGQLLVGEEPLGMAVNPAGTRAYVAIGTGRRVVVIDLAANKVLPRFTGFGSTVFTVAVSPDNQTLYVGARGKVYFLDATTGSFLDSIPAATALHIAVHPVQPFLYASMNRSGQVVEINTTTRQVIRTFSVGGVPQGIGVSPAGDHLYVANENKSLQVWDLAVGQQSNSVPLAGRGFGLGVTADVVIVAEYDGRIEVFDRATLQRRALLMAGGRPRRVAINSAGTVAVVANTYGWVDFIE